MADGQQPAQPQPQAAPVSQQTQKVTDVIRGYRPIKVGDVRLWLYDKKL